MIRSFFKCLAFLPLLSTPNLLGAGGESLSRQIELAKAGGVYLLLEPESIRVLVGALTMRSLAARQEVLVGTTTPRCEVKVDQLEPAPPKIVVEACVECDDKGGDVPASDRIGLDAMPSNFLVALEDGSQWIVLSQGGSWAVRPWRDAIWHWKALPAFLRSFSEKGWTEVRVLRLSPSEARSLYWSLQPGMPVLFSKCRSF